MKASFLHLGDVHLGNEQYGRKERAADFADAFHFALDYAIQHQVDFVLVAGDLFERATLDPMTFDQSLSGLKKMAEAGIPLVVIAGNHDRARYGQEIGWLESLGRQGFLQYLDAVAQGAVSLAPWSFEEGVGGTLEFRGLRLVGFRYVGAATARVVEDLGKLLREQDAGTRPYTIAMVHAGLDGEVPGFRAELTYDQLAPLRDSVDYVALGHLHKHYEREGWVYNPGSLETWNASETAWERGFLHVKVDTSAEPRHTTRLVTPPRRAFLRRRLDVQPCTSPEDLLDLARRSALSWQKDIRGEKPVVHLTLEGRLRFDRGDLDVGRIQAEVSSVLDPLVALVRDQTEETDFGPTAANDETADIGVMELGVLRQLFANDERFVRKASAWAKMAQHLKQDVLEGHSPQELADLVRREAPALLASDPGEAGEAASA